MRISASLKEDIESKGVPAWFVHELFDHNYNNDGMLLSWMFLPLVAELPVCSTYNEKYGRRAAVQGRSFTNAAMHMSLRCFKETPGFQELGSELEGLLKETWTWGLRNFFNRIRLKHDRTSMERVIEASFWSSHDYERREGDWGFNPMNHAAHAAHVFTEASKLLGEEVVWVEAVKALQEAVNTKGNVQ